MARRRGFGEVERRVGANKVVTFRARYAMPDGSRFSRTLATRMDAEAWLATERSLIDRDKWTPPPQRKAAEARRDREASYNTVKTFAWVQGVSATLLIIGVLHASSTAS